MLSFEEAKRIGRDFCVETLGKEYCLRNREGCCLWHSSNTGEDVVNVGLGVSEDWDKPMQEGLLAGETPFEVYVDAEVVRSTGEIRILEKHLPKAKTEFAIA